MRNQKEKTVVSFVGELLCNGLKSFKYGNTNGIFHYIGKFIPNNQQAFVIGFSPEFLLYFDKPGSNILLI